MSDAPQPVVSDRTLVPLGMIGAVIVTIVGGVFWLTSIFIVAENNTAAIGELKVELSRTNDSRAEYRRRLWESIRHQDKRLAIIEGKLDVIKELMAEQARKD